MKFGRAPTMWATARGVACGVVSSLPVEALDQSERRTRPPEDIRDRRRLRLRCGVMRNGSRRDVARAYHCVRMRRPPSLHIMSNLIEPRAAS